jgi:putative PIN family toxin of toxin-antitoxin system
MGPGSESMMPVRVVLDTNCLVSALIFSRGKAGQLRTAWQRGDIIPLVCRETVTELIRVLGYPKFNLDREDIDSLLADVLPWAETVEVGITHDTIEALRDKDDTIFIHLAQTADVVFFVSGDRHLLELRDTFPELNILSLADCIDR